MRPTGWYRTTAVTLLMLVGLVGCTGGGPGAGWTGGRVQPPTITLTVNPSAPPVGDALRTGLVLRDQELILYFWRAGAQPLLSADWRDGRTGAIRDQPPVPAVVVWALDDPRVLALAQLDGGDGTLVEYGAVRAPADRITIADRSAPVEARFTPWSADPSVVIFWLRRSGRPVPANTRSGDGLSVPLAPDRYPLVTVYDRAGATVLTVRLRPEATEQKGG